jgi:hypothetical protein
MLLACAPHHHPAHQADPAGLDAQNDLICVPRPMITVQPIAKHIGGSRKAGDVTAGDPPGRQPARRMMGLMLRSRSRRIAPRRPCLRNLLEHPARRRDHGLQLRADGPHRLRTAETMGGLAPGWPQQCSYIRTDGGEPGWPPVSVWPGGRPIAQWPRLAAGRSDDIGTGNDGS